MITNFFSKKIFTQLFIKIINKHVISAISYPEIKLIGLDGSGFEELRFAPAEKHRQIIK